MDDGSQKLLDVIDDPSALESFLGLSAAAAGESSSRTTLESLVDSLQQGLLDPNATAGGGASSARHATAGTPQTAPAGSLVLTQQQLQQLQQFQAGNAGGRPQGQAVTFSLPPHSSSAPIASSAPTVLTTSSSSSTHHFVLTPFHHAGGGNGSQPQHPQPITLINPSTQQVSSSVAQPSSFISASTAGTVSHLTNPNIAIGHGGTILTTSTAGLHVGGAVPSTGMTAIGSSAGGPSMQNLATNSTAGSNIFGASIIPASNSSTGNSVLVGPTGTTVFAPAISSPGSPFSVPTRSPAPHAPPTPSPSPLPLRSPASVSSHHPPSPAPSPYHTQLQSPQQPQQQPQPQQQQPQTNVANTSYILSANAGQNTPQNILKEHFGSLQTHSVSSSQTPSSFVLSTANTTFKDVYNMQQPSSQASVVVLPQQRSSLSSSAANTSPSPAQSPFSNLQSPATQQSGTILNQHLVSTRSPAPGVTQSAGTLTSGGALTPAPSPSPQTRTAASPVIRSTTPQPSVIHQTLPSGLAISGAGQFPVMPPGSTAMLQGNHQLVQIIHHTAAPQTSTFPAHTQIITTGPGGTVPLQQAATAVGGPPKPKQPPQILPKPPSGQPTAGTHTKIAANARATASTQHQGIHAQHHTSASAAQVVIGQANPTAVIPTAQTGTLLVNQVIPGIPPGGPLLVQPNPSGSVQLILRSPTPGTQAAASNQGTQHGQQPQQGKSPTPHQQPMFISGATTAQLVHNAGRQQMQQVLRLITAQGPMQLQQIQTPSGPTLIAVPSGPTLSFQQLGPQTPAPAPATVPPQIPPQPPQGPRPSTPQQQQPQPQQPTPAAQPTTSSIIPTVQLHQSAMRPSLTTGTSCAPQQSVSAVIGGHSISVGNANATPTIIHQNHQQHSQQDVSSAQQNPSFPIIRHNQTVLPAQQHQCTGTNTDQTALMKKKPKKKKIKKKKDEEPKLDLANIMKLSGIGEDEDMAIYEPEEAQVAQGAQSPAAIEQAPGNQQPQQPQQSQLIAQLRSPPQIPIQSGSGGTTSLRLALEDGHVVLHHAATPNNPQQPATNILLQNLPSAVGQQQQNVSTGQNQLPALLASGTCGPSTNNHMVLSQLLQQTSPPSLPPHLLPSSNSSTNRSTTSTSPNTTNTVPPQPKDRFTMVQQGAKTGFVKDSFSSGDLPNASISKLDASVSSVPNTTPAAFGIHTKTSGGSLSCPNFRDGFLQPGSNKVDSSTSTCSKPSSTPPPGLILTHDNATNLLLAKSPHQHPCQQDITIKQPQDTVQKQNSATTQTEIIHPNIHLGTKQQQPQQDSIPFISASKPGADSGPTFLGLHPFSNIQGLVSTTGASVPLVTGPVMTSGGGSFGGEQLLIAHHGGMSVLAAPQLIQYLQQAQNAAAPGINIMPQLHLTPNAVNKAIGQGIAFNTQAGTILIGGTPETFGATMNNQHKPSIMTATNNAAATKLLPPHQSSVLLQQLNALSGTGAPSALRRCSSDSNNSSISIGSPPPGGGGSASGATAVIGLINQPVVTQSSPMAASAGPRKNQQSIETQTISLGIPTTTSFQNSFLETIAHSHPNQVLGKLTHVTVAPKTTATTAAVVAAAQAAAAAQAGKKKKPKQTRNTKILPVVPSTNRQCNSTGTSPLQERNFAKPNTVCQGTQHVAQTTSNDTSFYVTSPPFTIGQQTRSCNTSTATTVPPLTSICTVGSTATTTVTTSAMVQPVVSKTTSNHGIQSTTEVATSNSHHAGPPPTSKHHCVASQTVSMQQPQSGLVPHLVPIPPGGNAATPAMSSIIQKVQTIQLTPQNQKHLKAVQLQIQSVQGKRMLTPGDQAVLHRLYEEQQRILLTGKVVPTIPGQHAVGLPLNPDGIPSSLDGKQKIQAEVDMSTANTYLANLLRQQSVVPHQNTQLPVRYPHQVGNRIIPLTPANLPKPAPSSSVATTSTTASTTTTRASISVQCSTPSDGLIQQSVGLATQTIPKLSVVQPIVQSPGPSSTQLNKSSSCEKGTSPLQVQVGTQTALPCLDTPSSGSPHLSTPVAICSGKLSPSNNSSKLSPIPAQQLFSPGKQQVQPIFGSPSTASNSKLQPSFSPPSTAKSCSQSAVVGSKLLVGGGKPQAVVAPVSPSDSTSSRSSPVMVTMAGNVKRPTVTSPIRPTFSRSDFIEQQLKTDQSGACMPDTSTPFQSTSDACKRLIRYHVFNEQLLSQQDLEKADEFFEATAKHLLDKFRQMMNKYRYLLLMESMREVNTSELMMIDRMFVAEEHALLERMKEEECRAKEGPVETAEQQPSSPLPAGVLATVKTEPGLSTAGGTTGSSPGEGLREVRVVVRDVMKNESIKRELEEDRKFTVVKRERLDSPANNRDVHQAYDEWEEIQKELGVYCGPNNNIPASGSTYTPPVKVEEESLPILSGIKAERESVSVNETDKKTSPPRDQVENGQKAASSESPGTKVRSGSCGPRDEGGGTEDDDVEEQDDDDDEEQTTEVMEDVKRTEESSGCGGEKRKEFCDTNVDATMSIGHRKKRHKHSYSPQHDDCADDENDDINAQVQCAINSILNLQRSEDGFDIRPNATVPSCDMGADESSDCEDTRQYESAKPCSARSRHKRNSASCKSAEQQVVNHHEDNADSALDEAVRSILTS